jgi:signal transduction histidine kinase
MRTRAERCGGTLNVKSERGRGTQIVARLPLE